MTMTSITGPNKNNISHIVGDCPRREIGTVPDPVSNVSGGTVPNFSQSVVVESGLSPHKGGITLMEMLVVIVIIVVLVGTILPAVTSGMKKSYVRRAETTIAALKSALEMYKRDWGYYPESTGDAADGADQKNGNQGGLVSSLTGSIKLDQSADTPKRGQPYVTFKKGDLNSTGLVLLDPWGNAYIYIARKYGNASGSVKNANTAHGPFWPYTQASERTRNTYNIYSLGPDAKGNGTLTGNNTGNYTTSYFDEPEDGNNAKTGSYLGSFDTYNNDDVNSWGE